MKGGENPFTGFIQSASDAAKEAYAKGSTAATDALSRARTSAGDMAASARASAGDMAASAKETATSASVEKTAGSVVGGDDEEETVSPTGFGGRKSRRGGRKSRRGGRKSRRGGRKSRRGGRKSRRGGRKSRRGGRKSRRGERKMIGGRQPYANEAIGWNYNTPGPLGNPIADNSALANPPPKVINKYCRDPLYVPRN